MFRINQMIAKLNIFLDKGIFHTSAMTFATIMVLFFTLLIIPIQRYASEYSPTLLRYFRKQKFPKIVFGILLIFFCYNIYFMIFPYDKTFVLLSGIFLIVSMILLGILITYVLKMLNPCDSLFPSIYKECKVYIKRNVSKKRKKIDKDINEKGRELKEIMDQILVTSEKVSGAIEKFKIHDYVINGLAERILPLKSVIISLIMKGDYETFVRAINTFRDVNINYFMARKEYRSYLDSLMFTTYETLEDFIKVAETSANIYFMREILRVAQEVALSTVGVNVIGINRGGNNLTLNLCNLINDSIKRNILLDRVDAAYEGARYLGNVGEILARGGLAKSAAKVCDDLADVVVRSVKLGKSYITYPAINGMAKIFYNALYNRKLFPNCDRSYNKMIESYKKVLNVQDITSIISISSDLYNPIIQYSVDMMEDISVNALVRTGLFSLENDDKEVEHNINAVNSIIEMMKEFHNKDHIISDFYTDQLYQISLWLIAFLDENIVVDLLIYQRVANIPTVENKKKVTFILFELIKYFSDIFLQSMADREVKVDTEEIGNIILSDLYLLLYLNKEHSIGLENEIENAINYFLDKLSAAGDKISYTMAENLRLFNSYLGKLNYDKEKRKISKVISSLKHGVLNIEREYLLDYVRRPIVTFDQNLFIKIDREIFGA